MLIEMLTSLDRGFILGEQQALLADIPGYIEPATQTFESTGPRRLLGNVYLTLERNRGSGAALGFLITLQLLRTWAERRGDHGWLAAQYEAVHTMGKQEVGEYVISFLDEPSPKINCLAERLTADSLLRGFIIYGEKKWPQFSIGAYLLIGLILYTEPSEHAEKMFAM